MEKRSIKFKAWDNTLKRMLVPSPVQSKHSFMTWDGLCYENGYLLDYTMLQWTGLKDKNGKEIYEGDIFMESGWKAVVIFANGCFGYSFPQRESDFTTLWYVCGKYNTQDKSTCEVIGNIYENPELINP